MSTRFEADVIDTARRDFVIGVRAGYSGHKFTAVWCVVVEGRLFARSWGLRADGWRAIVACDGDVTIQVGGTDIVARAIVIRSERVNAAVDEAYRAKYHTPASAEYVAGLTTGERRRSTVEFVPRDPERQAAAPTDVTL